MLIKKQMLTLEAKKTFKVYRNPFSEEVLKSSEDVFDTPDIQYIRERMFDTAKHGGFIALIGESGAGKSTLKKDLIEHIRKESLPIIIIEPYTIAMEDDDKKGKTLKANTIAESIISTLAPREKIKRNQDAKYRQLHRLLKNSSAAGYSHTLVMEEAHSLPIPTLKHLKRFFEMEFGFTKLISIVLIGQPELADKLSERNPEIREVVQRCHVIELTPLDNCLRDFLNFKLSRVGKNITDIIDDSAIAAIQKKLTYQGSRQQYGSLLYPLAIGNIVIAGMNLAATIGATVVTADIINNI